MNDCANADIRDQLPDMLHERLSASARAAVMAHVSNCPDCRDELELVPRAHGLLVAPAARGTPQETVALTEEPTPVADVGAEERLAGLNERQLKTLLGEIARLQPVPVTDPEPIATRVNTKAVRFPRGVL